MTIKEKIIKITSLALEIDLDIDFPDDSEFSELLDFIIARLETILEEGC